MRRRGLTVVGLAAETGLVPETYGRVHHEVESAMNALEDNRHTRAWRVDTVLATAVTGVVRGG